MVTVLWVISLGSNFKLPDKGVFPGYAGLLSLACVTKSKTTLTASRGCNVYPQTTDCNTYAFDKKFIANWRK